MRYIFTAVIIFIVIILGLLIFRRGPSKAPTAPKSLVSFADTSVEVRLTASGEINGDDEHREVIITVGRNQRVAQVVQGYQGNVIKTESFTNNENAYAAFLSALEVGGFTRQRTSRYKTEAGLCPLGIRYVYEIINNDDEDMRTWSTSCSGPSTFAGNAPLTRELFQNQITDYSQFVSGVNL